MHACGQYTVAAIAKTLASAAPRSTGTSSATVADRVTTPAYLVTASSTDCLASCMPSRDPRYGNPQEPLRSRPLHQSGSWGAWWLVWVRGGELLHLLRLRLEPAWSDWSALLAQILLRS